VCSEAVQRMKNIIVLKNYAGRSNSIFTK